MMHAVSENDTNSTDGKSSDDGILMDHNYRKMTMTELKDMLGNEKVSKNQKKKINKQIKWLETADARKALRKKRKVKHKEKNIAEGRKRPKFETITTVEDFHLLCHIAVDLSFDKLMTNRDIQKLGKQIAWCYKENRRSTHPVQYHICGLEERLGSSLDPSYKNWDVHFDKAPLESFPKDKITYLTAESENVLEEFKPGIVYVIGGLVDHNHQKGLCQRLADENGIVTARLPLEENIDIKTRRVLTVNHVFEILLAYRETKSWKEAILKIMPQKKLTPTSRKSNNVNDSNT
uniref:tRNA methyltransferase 10 homolog A n=1 Tax=Phallusia mammillata TaxID=59560 RepID=A0A6F9DWK6_9ASCI|nr:tRNA methyltransferase 10 homolog A-like [Phallusia mammillata]